VRILLTGGQGFIGQAFLQHLPRSWAVLSVVRKPQHPPQLANVEEVLCSLSSVRDIEPQIRAFGPDWCVHLAWDGLPDYSMERCRQNVSDSLTLFEVVARVGVKHFMVSGSCWEYGSLQGCVNEESSPVNLAVFGASKRAIHTILEAMARQEALTLHWARIFFAYGPGQRPTSLIPHLIGESMRGKSLSVRNPSVVQDFIHIDDVARALISLLNPEVPGGAYNIGTGRPDSVGSIAKTVATVTNAELDLDLVKGDANSDGIWADIEKIKKFAGWQPQIDLVSGIQRTYQAFIEASPYANTEYS
jgi:UDP-glucose 4-epimerase